MEHLRYNENIQMAMDTRDIRQRQTWWKRLGGWLKSGYQRVFPFLFLLLVPGTTFAAGSDPNCPATNCFQNPISAGSLPEFLNDLLTIIVKISIPVIVIFIIISGFMFVAAQGNEEKLKRARGTLIGVIIGAAIILGAKVLASVVYGTIHGIGIN